MRTTKVGSRVERKEIRMDLEQQLMNPAADLQLNQGDLIVVPQSSWVAINDVLTVLTTAAVITTAIVSVINITR
ncbi:hypothetical protein EHM92_04205 [bacterium]|nr:MAG: hypothetical protein EHM92_04205 [bacterium]